MNTVGRRPLEGGSRGAVVGGAAASPGVINPQLLFLPFPYRLPFTVCYRLPLVTVYRWLPFAFSYCYRVPLTVCYRLPFPTVSNRYRLPCLSDICKNNDCGKTKLGPEAL